MDIVIPLSQYNSRALYKVTFLRFCGKAYRNLRTILRTKGNEVSEKWSALLELRLKAYILLMHTRVLSFDANVEMTCSEKRITMSAHSP